MTESTESDGKREMYEELLKNLGEGVATWSDFYGVIHARMKKFMECHCQGHALEVLYPMYAFILSLEALPEEGDIKVIVERMARIMAYEAKEKLGAELVHISSEDLKTAATVFAKLGTHIPFGEEMAGQEAVSGEAPITAPVKKHLH